MAISLERFTRAQHTRLEPPSLALKMFAPALIGLDLLIITAATIAAVVGRQHLDIFPRPSDDFADLVPWPVLTAMILAWLAVLWLVGCYRYSVFGAGTEEYKLVVNGSALTAAGIGIGCYLTQFPLARGFYVLAFAFGMPLLLLNHFATRRFLQRQRAAGRLQHRVLLVGNTAHVDEIAAVLRRERWLGYEVLGALTPRASGDTDLTPAGIPVLGYPEEVPQVLRLMHGDTVFFTNGAYPSANLMRMAQWDLETTGAQVILAPNLTEVSSQRVQVRPVAGLPLVHLDGSRAGEATRWAKRVFDLLGATLIGLLVAPLFLVLALWIKREDGGPVFYRQERVGRDGRTFHCWKFRSMVVGADRLVADLRRDHGVDALMFKMADDPRITAPGRFLRRFSLDELPQLWNVVRGDMSLVGPRPPLPSEAEAYDDSVARRLRVRPGMTGLWQVSGRSDLSWEDTVRLDLYYVDNWSMVQDLAILFRTVSAVLGSRGAY